MRGSQSARLSSSGRHFDVPVSLSLPLPLPSSFPSPRPTHSPSPSPSSTRNMTQSPNSTDYSSHGASVEEVRPDRWTAEYARSLTPRSIAACQTNGILPEELIYRPIETFKPTTKENQPLPTAAAAAIIQQLRYKDYETSRLVALEKVRTTRRRQISGLRHSLFGLKNTTQRSDSNTTLPHVHENGTSSHSLHSRSRTQSLSPSRTQTRNHSRTTSSNITHATQLYPPQHQITEHPFFKSHPNHDRLHNLQHVTSQVAPANGSSTNLPDSIEWNASFGSDSQGVGGHGHLCLRMREHLLRDQERAEWEAQEAKREARARQRRERLENEWYQEQKIQVKGYRRDKAKKSSDDSSPLNGTMTNGATSARLTRAEILRAAGANSLFQHQQLQHQLQQPNQQRSSAVTPAHETVLSTNYPPPPPSSGMFQLPKSPSQQSHQTSQQPSHRPSVSMSLSNNNHVKDSVFITSSVPISNPTSSTHASSSSSSSSSKPDPSRSVDELSLSYEDRHHQSIASIANRYTTFFEREKSKIVARQENEIASLAAAEKHRYELAKKQEESEKKRIERAKLLKARRETLAKELQSMRESKYARVVSEEVERIRALEKQYEEKHDKIVRKRAEYEQQLRDGIQQRQTEAEQRNEERRWSILQAHEEKHRRLLDNLHYLYQRYEHANAKLLESKHRQSVERHHRNQAKEKKLHHNLERQADECRRKYEEYFDRTEKHAIKDTALMIKRAQDIATQRAIRTQEKEELKQSILAMKEEERRARVEQILEKDRRDAERLRELEERKSYHHLLLVEQKNLETQRKERNLEREHRRKAYQHQQLADKVAQAHHRLDSIASMKANYSKQREDFAKRTVHATRTFRETYAKLRTKGALAAIVKEAKMKQKEIDDAKEE